MSTVRGALAGQPGNNRTNLTFGREARLPESLQGYDMGMGRSRIGGAMRDAESRLAEAVCGVLLSVCLLAAVFLASLY